MVSARRRYPLIRVADGWVGWAVAVFVGCTSQGGVILVRGLGGGPPTDVSRPAAFPPNSISPPMPPPPSLSTSPPQTLGTRVGGLAYLISLYLYKKLECCFCRARLWTRGRR